MKSTIERHPHDIKQKIFKITLGLIICCTFSMPGHAESAKSKSKAKSKALETEVQHDLDLSMPQEWLEPEPHNPFEHAQSADEQQIVSKKNKKRPVNVDCGMEMNPYATSDSSLGNRLTGECDFNYRY